MISLKTQRLLLRPFVESDLQNLIDLDQDPEVMRYVGGNVIPNADIAAVIPRLLQRQPIWKVYGTWAADLLETNENIGWFTLKPMPQLNNEYEVGYRLKKKFWGQGLATEGARFLVEYGFTELKLPKIIGLTHLENSASQNILQKCGLIRQPDIKNPFPEIPNFWPADQMTALFARNKL